MTPNDTYITNVILTKLKKNKKKNYIINVFKIFKDIL